MKKQLKQLGLIRLINYLIVLQCRKYQNKLKTIMSNSNLIKANSNQLQINSNQLPMGEI
jgi:hypothetical protein